MLKELSPIFFLVLPRNKIWKFKSMVVDIMNGINSKYFTHVMLELFLMVYFTVDWQPPCLRTMYENCCSRELHRFREAQTFRVESQSLFRTNSFQIYFL